MDEIRGDSPQTSPVSRRNILRFAIAAPAALAFTACTSSVASDDQPGEPSGSVSVQSMEEHFGHKLARPVESLGAQLTDSSFLRDGGAGATFAGEVAVLVYEWNGFRLAILQGPPARAWRLRETVTRPDARFATGAGGAETAILPSTDKSAPLAFLALKGWVVKVEAPPAPGTQNADLTVEELSTFVMGLSV